MTVKLLTGSETILLTGIAAVSYGHSSPLVTWASVLSPIVAAAVGAYLAGKLRQVHVIVNSQRTELQNLNTAHEARIAQLEEVIEGSDADVPATTRETGHP